jgi:glucose-1-phosphate adenylyltransferase
MERAAVADGCIIVDADVNQSLIGVRSRIEAGAVIRASLIMGCDYYETPDRVLPLGAPPMGIGPNTTIDGAIVDKNARIGRGVRISPAGKPANCDGANYYVRDGIVIIPKGAVVPDGTVI